MGILDKIASFKLGRRAFLKWSAAVSALTALTGYENELKKITPAEAQEISEEKGEWKNAPCWHNCGGRCHIKALVSGGKIVRLKTDDTHPDSIDYPQLRACARGHAQRQQVAGPDRLKYPMKRTHWEHGGGDKSLRGRDTWERISWDEALDIVASEIKISKEKYGPKSIFLMDEIFNNQGGEIFRVLGLYGGYMSKYGSRSRGAWRQAMRPILGYDRKFHNQNDRLDLVKAKLILLWGSNPAWNSYPSAMNNLIRAKEAGAKIIAIDPMYTTTASVIADEYIPIRPATDTPLLLAMAYVMLKEDSPEKPMIDWDFLNRCTVGFDSEHMPEGADPKMNFKDYVLGNLDGLPKTPEWASKICGTPVDTIYKLAREVGLTKPVTALFAWNSARADKATHVCLAQVTLAAMTGNMGIAGGAFSCSCQERSTEGGPALVAPGGTGVKAIKNPVPNSERMCANEHWRAILTGKYTAGKGNKKDLDVHVIYHAHSNIVSQTANTMESIEAHKKVDFIVTHQFLLNSNAKFSDVVLPITTPWERDGMALGGAREVMIWTQKVIDPLFEAKDDGWIALELGKRLGLDPKEVEPVSLKQQNFNMLAGAKVAKPDNSGMETLLTITAEDIKAMGVEGEPQQGRITLSELREKGSYQVPRKMDDAYYYINNKAFRDDPEKNPLKTRDGKVQIYCGELAEMVDKAGWNEGHPIAIYEPSTEGYEATFSDFEKGIKGKYPLQVCSVHVPRGAHGNVSNSLWLREAFPIPLLMNPADAEPRGLKEDDTVKVFNDHGTVVRRLHITERVMPGVVMLGEGSWVQLNEDGYDIGGCPNVLTGTFPSGPDIESFVSIAEVAKYDKPSLPDALWPQRIIF